MLRHAAAHVLVDDIIAPTLDEGSAHHLFRVLRVRDGEVVTVTDGSGAWRVCRAERGELLPVSEQTSEPRRLSPVTVAFAIPKHDRPEWIAQKLTEVGVDRIVVLHAERSVVRWDADRAERHLHKLRRVAIEALQQSRGVWLPEISGPVWAADLLPDAVVAEPGGRPVATADRVVAIGPEGGWTEGEIAVARGTVSLGATVLRVETAALAAGIQLVRV